MTTSDTLDTPDTSLLEGLTPEQRAAAVHGDGPLLIVAGAGTGKTATLAHRVAEHIERAPTPAGSCCSPSPAARRPR